MGVADQIVSSWLSSIELRNKACVTRKSGNEMSRIMSKSIPKQLEVAGRRQVSLSP